MGEARGSLEETDETSDESKLDLDEVVAILDPLNERTRVAERGSPRLGNVAFGAARGPTLATPRRGADLRLATFGGGLFRGTIKTW